MTKMVRSLSGDPSFPRYVFHKVVLILCKLGLLLQGWRTAREGVNSRRENWAGARTSELVPSVPGASGIMRSDSLVSSLSGRFHHMGGSSTSPQGRARLETRKMPSSVPVEARFSILE